MMILVMVIMIVVLAVMVVVAVLMAVVMVVVVVTIVIMTAQTRPSTSQSSRGRLWFHASVSEQSSHSMVRTQTRPGVLPGDKRSGLHILHHRRRFALSVPMRLRPMEGGHGMGRKCMKVCVLGIGITESWHTAGW